MWGDVGDVWGGVKCRGGVKCGGGVRCGEV